MRNRLETKWLVSGVLTVLMAMAPVAATQAAQADHKGARTSKPAKVVIINAAKQTKQAKAAKAAPANAVLLTARSPARRVAVKRVALRSVVLLEPAPASFGHMYGLQKADDALDLKSSVALVVDQDTDEVLFSKNSNAVLPIASITKLMTALVVTEAGLPLEEMLTVSQDDVEATAGSSSRLRPGTQLSRGEMLHLALMSSENRAAHLLGRSYPGGIEPFVVAMNAKARALGMTDTRYVEPTGLSSNNQSSAQDLAKLVRAASVHPIIRSLSTSHEHMVSVGAKQLQFRSTNALVRSPGWDIGLQKTGYISAAGRCLVMQAQMAGRKLIMVLLDSAGKYSRVGDAERIRKWLATAPGSSGMGLGLSPARPAGPLQLLPGSTAAGGLLPSALLPSSLLPGSALPASTAPGGPLTLR